MRLVCGFYCAYLVCWFGLAISPGGSTAVLQVLLALWNAAEHQQAAELLIPKMLEARLCWRCVLAHLCGCSPGTTEAQLREGLRFNGDGTLERWNLIGCNLTALPEEFGAVRTTGTLYLHVNKLTSLPESFGNLRVGGNLVLKGWM